MNSSEVRVMMSVGVTSVDVFDGMELLLISVPLSFAAGSAFDEMDGGDGERGGDEEERQSTRHPRDGRRRHHDAARRRHLRRRHIRRHFRRGAAEQNDKGYTYWFTNATRKL